jgi:mannose-6-phosphate isomerase-like protein (cupin superfamily)
MALLNNRDKEDRPWGSFERFTLDEISTVKILRVAPEKRLSLQYHERRGEFWRVISGDGIVSIDGQDFPAHIGDEFEIPVRSTHRLTGGPEGMAILEIALGQFDETDIVRIEDDFGRNSTA